MAPVSVRIAARHGDVKSRNLRPIRRAFAVAIEQAVQAVQRQVPQRIAARTGLCIPSGFEPLDDGKEHMSAGAQIISLSPRRRQRAERLQVRYITESD